MLFKIISVKAKDLRTTLFATKKYSGVYVDDGLGIDSQKRYADRREKLVGKLTELTLINGEMHDASEHSTWDMLDVPFFQNPTFQYLTGISQSGCALMLDPNSKESRVILFLPDRDPATEFWNGVRIGVGDSDSEEIARNLSGIAEVRPFSDLSQIVKERLLKQEKQMLNLYWNEGMQDSHAQFKNMLEENINKNNKIEFNNIALVIDSERVIFDETDKKNEIIANKITTKAYVDTWKAVKNYSSEMEVSGHLVGELRKQTPKGLAFPNIVAAGKNATTLHYLKNDEPFNKDGDLILFDGGARWQSMNADVSRTFPANGKFDPMQRILYQIVLDTQKEVERYARAGLTIKKLNNKAWRTLEQLLKERFIDKGGIVKRDYKKGRPHGVSHLLGHQTHDADIGDLYTKEPMKPGWIISNEPGLYGYFEIELGGIKYSQYLGIRIEDDLYIKENGCENLTDCPREIAEIEAIMQANI